ncbi:polysaccharide biosynthesis tyrosine autokinase [Leptolyngbya sp. CCY15150]|uniref:GumC family protein n=1 Tax=Leptolyngbya sp. CCY15150 TaxID=2767772 RepID=UPI00194F92A7|nr:polysaccharide biosynthesis tyrosine autokinase [Leptolyngbya sp. CCY15150]
MPENRSEDLSTGELGYGQILSVLWRHRLWIIGALLVTIPIAAHNSRQKEPTYRSSMQLLIESNYRERPEVARARAEQNRLTEGAPIEIDYATQIRIMQGSQLMERAVGLLQSEYPDITTDEIQSRLAVSRVTETEDEVDTKILQVDYTSNDPEKAQDILEAMRTVYLDYNLEQQEVRIQDGLSFIAEQIPQTREALRTAEQSLEEFRAGQSLIDPQQRAGGLAEALTTVEQERRQIRAEFEGLQAQYNVLQDQLARSPENALVSSRLSESARYQNLLNEYQQVELALSDLAVTFTDDAPNVRRLREQLERQRALLQQEMNRVLGENSASVLTSPDLLSEGQLGEIDRTLTGELVQTQTALSGLAARDRSLAEVEQQLREELSNYPELIAEYDRLQPEIQIQRDTLQQLLRLQQELSIDIARGGFNWQIVEDPQYGYQTGPNFKMDVILGGIAGLFLGIVLAFVREAMDGSIRSTQQLRESITVPLLGTLPWFKPSSGPQIPGLGWLPGFQRSSASESVILLALNWLPFREALDLVYKNIQLLSSDKSSTSIAVTSPSLGEGKSTLALGLAITAARLHQRVLLIDADLRNPTLHTSLNLPGDRGLSTYLMQADAYPLMHHVTISDCSIDVLPAGEIPSDPVRLLSSPTMHNLVRDAEQQYDLVVIDSSPVLGTVDALQTASVCRNTLLMTCLHKISKTDLTQALDVLMRFDLLGVVANHGQPVNPAYSTAGGPGQTQVQSLSVKSEPLSHSFITRH